VVQQQVPVHQVGIHFLLGVKSVRWWHFSQSLESCVGLDTWLVLGIQILGVGLIVETKATMLEHCKTIQKFVRTSSFIKKKVVVVICQEDQKFTAIECVSNKWIPRDIKFVDDSLEDEAVRVVCKFSCNLTIPLLDSLSPVESIQSFLHKRISRLTCCIDESFVDVENGSFELDKEKKSMDLDLCFDFTIPAETGFTETLEFDACILSIVFAAKEGFNPKATLQVCFT